MRIRNLKPEFVEFIPAQLDAGRIYISRTYATASHLCCCGCGMKVVTPLNPAKWHLEERDGRVSLRPSIGNWSFPCRSHYWVRNNEVVWAGTMSERKIAQVKARDKADAEAFGRVQRPSPRGGMFAQFVAALNRLRRWFGG